MVNEEFMCLKSPKSCQLAFVVLLTCLHLGSAFAQSEIKSEVSKAEKLIELVYQSSFQNYQRYSASDIQTWKQANDTVKDIGGWREYAKEIAQEPDTKPSSANPSHGAHR
jgi:high-affinity Fe2+/Pb2+ permease